MADPISLQTLLTYLTLISVPVGVFYHILTLRNTKRNQELTLETRQAQLFMQAASQSVSDPEFMKSWHRLRGTHWETFDEYTEWLQDPQNLDDTYRVGGLLESLSVLVREDLINIRLVALLMTNIVIDYWEKFLPILKELSSKTQIVEGYEIEYLYEALQEYRKIHSPR